MKAILNNRTNICGRAGKKHETKSKSKIQQNMQKSKSKLKLEYSKTN